MYYDTSACNVGDIVEKEEAARKKAQRDRDLDRDRDRREGGRGGGRVAVLGRKVHVIRIRVLRRF